MHQLAITAQKRPLRAFDSALLQHLADRMLGQCSGKTGKAKIDPLMKTFSEMMSPVVGGAAYCTLQSAFHLAGESTCRFERQKDIKFHVGINEQALEDSGALSKLAWSVSMGDGTRIMRMLEPMGQYLVGNVFSPDCAKWPTMPGIPIPQKTGDLVKVITAVHGKECLAHELHLEALKTTTEGDASLRVYMAFPEPHRGNTGFWHFKMWSRFVELHHKHGIACVGFTTDSCSTGLSAARILMTPNKDLIEAHGITYCGLPDTNYKYFSAYLRPRDMAGYVPPPYDWYGETAHGLRNGRKLLGNAKKTIVFYSEQDNAEEGTVEAGEWASNRYLKIIAAERGR
jgi:hypothetical protein